MYIQINSNTTYDLESNSIYKLKYAGDAEEFNDEDISSIPQGYKTYRQQLKELHITHQEFSNQIRKINQRLNDPTVPDSERLELNSRLKELKVERDKLTNPILKLEKLLDPFLRLPNVVKSIQDPFKVIKTDAAGEIESKDIADSPVKYEKQKIDLLSSFDPTADIKYAEYLIRVINNYEPGQGQKEIDKQPLIDEVNSIIVTLRYFESLVKDAIEDLYKNNGQELNSIKNRLKEIYDQLTYVSSEESLDLENTR